MMPYLNFLKWIKKLREIFSRLIKPSQYHKQAQSTLGDQLKASGTQPVQKKDNQQPPSQAATGPEDAEPDTSTVDEVSDDDENGASIADTEGTEDRETQSPYNIGGMRKGKGDDSNQSRESLRQSHDIPPVSRPELICRQSQASWGWDILLSVDEGLSVRRIQHGNKDLDLQNDECRLESFHAQLIVEHKDSSHGITPPHNRIPLFSYKDPKPFIFKLRSNWTGDGRHVSGISCGHYIVIAPAEWNRTGTPPLEPEQCTDKEFKAHYFLGEKGGAESIGGFKEYTPPTVGSGIELKGKTVFDDSDEGKLFVGAAPKLCAGQGVVWARLGSEGGEWKGENFKPSEKELREVLGDRQGRFYVRVYGKDRKLVDSEQFRYLRNLKEIRVNGERHSEETFLFPNVSGHPVAEVRFVPNGDVDDTFNGGRLTVKAHPDKDYLSCMLGTPPNNIRIVLRLPRIWSRLVTDEGGRDNWCDTPFSWTKQMFRDRAYAGTAIEVRLPLREKSVLVGFDHRLDRSYRATKKEPYEFVLLPLHDFIDSTQLDEAYNGNVPSNVVAQNQRTVTLVRIQAYNNEQICGLDADISISQASICAWESKVTEWEKYIENFSWYEYRRPGYRETPSSAKLRIESLETLITCEKKRISNLKKRKDSLEKKRTTRACFRMQI